jgi:hypothetical protein
MSGTLHLIANGVFTGLAIIGFATISNKIGKFLKSYENEKEDHFKRAFDKSMNETLSDVHSCVESVSIITNGITKASSVAIDLATGNKIISRKKGKIAIIEQSKAQKEQMDDLSKKLKKYELQIKKLKKKKNKESDSSSTESVSSLSGSENESETEGENKKSSKSYTLE